jgi:hypothetical protein
MAAVGPMITATSLDLRKRADELSLRAARIIEKQAAEIERLRAEGKK